MAINWLSLRNKRIDWSGRFAIVRAAANAIEKLEPRQLLSSVVATFPVPGASADTWDGSTAHIVAAPNGNYWFTDPTDNSVGEVTPARSVTMFPLPVHNVPLDDGSGGVGPDDPSPTDIVVEPNGNLWFTETGVDRIGEITPAGVITEFKTPTADSNPAGLTVGTDGDLWFAEQNNEAIGRITTAGKITEFPLATLDVSSTDGMATGSDGKVWFIADDSDGNGVVASITSTGSVNSYPLNADPTAIAAGPDGNLWIGTSDGEIEQVITDGVVTTFALPDGADVNSIRAGSDGNLWFSTDGSNQFGKITTAGVVSEYALPSSGADANNSSISPNNLTQGTDGSLWFIDSANPQIGTINLTNALLASGTSVTVTAGSTAASTFASFTDFSGSSAASDYTATITLADGSTLAGSIAANSTGGFDVTASNNWVIGDSNVTVIVTDTRDTSRVATATTSVDAAAPSATGTGVNVSADAAQVVSGTVATFTGVALNSLSQYSATIDWGDGHDTAGTITANNTGGFDIAGSNRYADSGIYTVTTTLSPYPGGVFYPGGPVGGPVVPVTTPVSTGGGTASSGATSTGTAIKTTLPSIVPIIGYGGTTASSTATIAAGAMNGTGYSVQAASTAPFSGNVADFALADPSDNLSHLTATVQWSDPGIRYWYFSLSNSPSAGVITPDGNGGFAVSTSASFASGGLFHFVVTISDDRQGTGDTAVVGVAYGQIIVDSPIRWLPVLLAHPPAAGVAAPGLATAVSNSDASNPVLAEKIKPIKIAIKSFAGQMFTGNVGAASGLISAAFNLADLTGTIHWGDGMASPATFVSGKKGHVLIRGSHAYSAAGNYAVAVDATQTLNVNGKPSTLYPLVLPQVESAARIVAPAGHHYITTGGVEITAVAGTEFSGPVASFPAPPAAGLRYANISWGDGKHSAAMITTSDTGQVTITGSHVYRKKGKYAALISVKEIYPISLVRGAANRPKILALIKTTAIVSAAIE